MIERFTKTAANAWDDRDDPSRETIALLTEEVNRLEAELRARDESGTAEPPARGGDGDHAEALQRRVEGLLAELASREETVVLLLDQARLFEEAESARQAEWEQLTAWVEEVERRVEGRDLGDDRLREELDAERSRSATLRKTADADRRAWDAQRRGLEAETEQLRKRVETQADEPGDETQYLALASENRRLRTANGLLERAAAEAEELLRRLAQATAEAEQARTDLRREQDERQREQREHEAERAALRSQSARATLGQVDPGSPVVEAPERPSTLEADERIRAFRQHLRELHDHEADQRASRTLSARLSRLWRHTGPGG